MRPTESHCTAANTVIFIFLPTLLLCSCRKRFTGRQCPGFYQPGGARTTRDLRAGHRVTVLLACTFFVVQEQRQTGLLLCTNDLNVKFFRSTLKIPP